MSKSPKKTARKAAAAKPAPAPPPAPPPVDKLPTRKKKISDSPYPGLNYYGNKKDDRDLFAGRKDEIIECGEVLFRSRVLILHGSTGCGKSSFLRAGIKPRIAHLDENARIGVGPDEHKADGMTSDQFDVIRSSRQPLREFVDRLSKIVARMSADSDTKVKKPLYGPIASPEALRAARQAFSSAEKITAMRGSASSAYTAYRHVQRALESDLILVIDQGEEVFTLNDERRLSEEYASLIAKPENKDLKFLKFAADRRDETRAYFEFLRLVAATGGGPLIVSLRTEYKGMFDDCIAGDEGHPGVWLKGYHLKPLQKEGIIQAILRPSLDQKEWDELVRKKEVVGAKRPKSKVQLKFTRERAEQLAEDLLKPDAIPPGGVLPALQVACTRLYEQAEAAMENAKTQEAVTVSRASIMRLGSVATQVEEYVSTKIEEACDLKGISSELTSGQLSTLIHQGLAKALVGVESDGRAVTRRLSDSDLRERFDKHFGKKLKQHLLVRDYLEDWNILRREDVQREGQPEETWWSLGHDSIALCLLKWRTPEGKEDPLMMRMAMMGASGNPSGWRKEDLYPEEELPNFEEPMDLAVPRDFLWDRQLPFFAAEKGFDKRLGFRISAPEHLDATDDTGKGPATWIDLVEEVRDESRARHDAGLDSPTKTSMIVAAEWGAFPLIFQTEIDDDNRKDLDSAATAAAERAIKRKKLEPEKYARYWTDIGTTNTNFGNGLIGPDIIGLPTLRQVEKDTNGESVEDIREGLRSILTFLVQTKPNLTYFDLRAKKMLLFAADLVFTRDENAERDRIRKFLNTPVFRGNNKYAIKDPIVDILLNQEYVQVKWAYDKLQRERSSAVKLEKAKDSVAAVKESPLGTGKQAFAVAGAFPRAMATQSGYKVYFGAKHVAWLARDEMDRRKATKRRHYAHKVSDLAEEMQGVISHTLWQFSLPNARWDLGADRARVLRLASLAYYTAEYARSSMDETVAFLQRFAIACLKKDLPGKDSLRGVRLNRLQVREAVADCFNFVRFDDYANDVFDLDAPFAYWSNHSDYESKSVAQAIYQELVSLRQATLTHFDTAVGAISWLRYDEAYFPADDGEVGRAFALKELAWKHFRIMNFYDSERFMGKAASILSERLATIGRDKKALQNQRNEDERKQAKSTPAE